MDREKVIKKLESLRDICNAKSNMAIGNGKVAWAGYANTADDALALLKEQEAVEPEEIVNEHFPIGDYRRTIGWLCGKCGKALMGDGDYCSYCGQAVKWDA